MRRPSAHRVLPGLLLAIFASASEAQVPGRAGTPPPPPAEVTETFKDWKLYCQVWAEPRRVECEIATRAGAGTNRLSRVVWLRSSRSWLDGLRFRVEERALDVNRVVRVWIDESLFRPEFPCKPFAFEPNTCTVMDPAVNERLVERMRDAKRVSVVGTEPGTGRKADIGFPLAGFSAAVERMEQIRAEAGVRWASPGDGS